MIYMKRIHFLKFINNYFKNSKFVSTIGITSKELYELNDNKNNFYMLGSMGLASSFGLGLALSSKKNHIIIFDGDGSILMNLGSLSTIGSYNLKNLLLIIFDNNSYETTGIQETNTSKGTNLYLIAKGSNCQPIYYFNDLKKLKNKIKFIVSGVIIIRIDPGSSSKSIVSIDPIKICDRFKRDF